MLCRPWPFAEARRQEEEAEVRVRVGFSRGRQGGGWTVWRSPAGGGAERRAGLLPHQAWRKPCLGSTRFLVQSQHLCWLSEFEQPNHLCCCGGKLVKARGWASDRDLCAVRGQASGTVHNHAAGPTGQVTGSCMVEVSRSAGSVETGHLVVHSSRPCMVYGNTTMALARASSQRVFHTAAASPPKRWGKHPAAAGRRRDPQNEAAARCIAGVKV